MPVGVLLARVLRIRIVARRWRQPRVRVQVLDLEHVFISPDEMKSVWGLRALRVIHWRLLRQGLRQ
jgi:hypothetical protein